MTYGLICTFSGNVRSGQLQTWLKFLTALEHNRVAVYLVDNSGSDDFFQELIAESVAYVLRFDKLVVCRYHKVRDAGDRVAAMVNENQIVQVNDSKPVFADVIHREWMQSSNIHNLPVNPLNWSFEREIKSFCTVATYNMEAELALMIDSLRRHHPDTPLVVFGDQQIGAFIKRHNGKIKQPVVSFQEAIFAKKMEETREKYGLDVAKQVRWASVIDPNPHRPEIIDIKMDAMEHAIKKYGDTMFLDADVILAAPIKAPTKEPLALSPHYNDRDKELTIGRYNAGMVWTCDEKFPEWWRHGFWEDSLFFEQECLNRASGTWKVAEYPETHNYGFWRMYSLGKCDRMVDVPELCRALRLEFSEDGPTLRGDPVQSWHVHPFSTRSSDRALSAVMRYLLRNSSGEESGHILKGVAG
jgi:hypothetical protein